MHSQLRFADNLPIPEQLIMIDFWIRVLNFKVTCCYWRSIELLFLSLSLFLFHSFLQKLKLLLVSSFWLQSQSPNLSTSHSFSLPFLLFTQSLHFHSHLTISLWVDISLECTITHRFWVQDSQNKLNQWRRSRTARKSDQLKRQKCLKRSLLWEVPIFHHQKAIYILVPAN